MNPAPSNPSLLSRLLLAKPAVVEAARAGVGSPVSDHSARSPAPDWIPRTSRGQVGVQAVAGVQEAAARIALSMTPLELLFCLQ